MTAANAMNLRVDEPAASAESLLSLFARRFVSSFVTTLFVVIAVLALTLSFALRNARTGASTLFGHPVMTVLSGSMAPTFRTGDLVVDDALNAGQASTLAVGEVITFHSPTDTAKLFTHRIVGVRHGSSGVSYVTKGDANNAPDAAPVPASDVVGLYSRRIPYAGYVLSAARNPVVVALTVVALVMWLSAGSLFNMARRSAARARTDPRSLPGLAEVHASRAIPQNSYPRPSIRHGEEG